MKFENKFTIPQATPTQVWPWLFEPAMLLAAVPGCRQVIWLEPQRQLRLVIQRRMGPLEARPLWVDITFSDTQPAHSVAYSFMAYWEGESETAVGHGRLRLTAAGSHVQLHVAFDWEATGLLASVGEPFWATQTHAALRQWHTSLDAAVAHNHAPQPTILPIHPPPPRWDWLAGGVAAVALFVAFWVGLWLWWRGRRK